jgi:hypothetical protein
MSFKETEKTNQESFESGSDPNEEAEEILEKNNQNGESNYFFSYETFGRTFNDVIILRNYKTRSRIESYTREH